MARSIKTRGLAVPETMPACLYPPGYEPPVAFLESEAKGSMRVGACKAVGAIKQSQRKRAKPSGADDGARQAPQRRVTIKTTARSDALMRGKTDPTKSTTDRVGKPREKKEKHNKAYEMHEREKIRYDKIFDKLTHGKTTNLGGKEVNAHEHQP